MAAPVERGHDLNCGNSDVIVALVEMEHPNLAVPVAGYQSQREGWTACFVRSDEGGNEADSGAAAAAAADRDAKSSIQRRRRDAGRASAVIR